MSTVTLPAATFERLRTAGTLLSNCAYNLAQQKGLPISPRAAQSLDECRKEWDAARDVVHQLLQIPTSGLCSTAVPVAAGHSRLRSEGG